MAINSENDPEIFRLKVDDTTKSFIRGSVGWAKFIAIIFSVLIVLFSGLILFINYIYLPEYIGTGQQMGAGSVIFIIAFIFLFNFFPVFFLVRFCVLVKKAVNSNNQVMFNRSMKFLKFHFMSVGIVVIVFIALYGLGLAVSAIYGR
jgi:hypothetical protein